MLDSTTYGYLTPYLDVKSYLLVMRHTNVNNIFGNRQSVRIEHK